MESGANEGEEALRDERNGQGEDHLQAQCQLGHEREEIPLPAQPPLPRQHVVRLCGQREPLPRNRPHVRRRSSLPYRKAQAFFRGINE